MAVLWILGFKTAAAVRKISFGMLGWLVVHGCGYIMIGMAVRICMVYLSKFWSTHFSIDVEDGQGGDNGQETDNMAKSTMGQLWEVSWLINQDNFRKNKK